MLLHLQKRFLLVFAKGASIGDAMASEMLSFEDISQMSLHFQYYILHASLKRASAERIYSVQRDLPTLVGVQEGRYSKAFFGHFDLASPEVRFDYIFRRHRRCNDVLKKALRNDTFLL
jgi:hypothetical protein